MKVDMAPLRAAHRGGPVEIGNVYACNRAPAFGDFRIVVGKATHEGTGRIPWNNVIMIHVNAGGEVVGCSRQPTEYVKNKWDLLGKVKQMPTLKIEWVK